jgi:hypothetical protein
MRDQALARHRGLRAFEHERYTYRVRSVQNAASTICRSAMLTAGNRLILLARHHPGVPDGNGESIRWPPVRRSVNGQFVVPTGGQQKYPPLLVLCFDDRGSFP